MKEYIAVERQTDSGGYVEIVSELIRCKDCRHFEADLDGMTMYCANEIMPTVFVCTGQGYCSEAERKEE